VIVIPNHCTFLVAFNISKGNRSPECVGPENFQFPPEARERKNPPREKQVFALSQLRMPFQHHTHFPEAFNDSLQVVQLANISWPLNKRQNNNLNELR